MDIHAQMILDEYKEKLPLYEKIEDIVKKELDKIVKDLGFLVNSVDTRIKTEKSLIGKLTVKGYKYKSIDDITDIVGARVVTFYSDEVDKISAMVEKRFKVDRENSVDKRAIYNIDQFGYMSLHYVCSIPSSLYKDKDYPELNNIKFEIQMRTTLQHAWASIYHDTGYKTDIEVPRNILRSLNRLASLLELADDEFTNIKTSLNEYRRKVKQIVASGDYNKVELTGDSLKEYVEAGGFDDLNNKIASINNMEIEKVNYMHYLEVFKDLNFKTLGDIEKFRKENSHDAYHYALRFFSGTDIDIVSNTIGMYCLTLVYILKSGLGESSVLYFLNYLFGPRPGNARQAKRAVNIGRELGMVKEISENEEKE